MDAGIALKTYWILFLLGFFGFVFGMKQAYANPAIRKKFDGFVLKLPLLSDLLKYSNFSNFIAVLQVAYEAGIPIVDCLFLANLTIDNHVLSAAILQVASKVQQGTHLSVALKGIKEVPKMMQFMIATGEQSGRLGDMLEKGVNFLDRTLDGIIDTMTKMIEPIMLLVIGSIVLVMALSLYLPLFQSYMQ
jgi:type II secretory pathway component PulF